MLRIDFFAHCGMPYTLQRGMSPDDAVAYLRTRFARWKARGYTVSRAGKWRWEITEPECSALVPDDAGILLVRHDTNKPAHWER